MHALPVIIAGLRRESRKASLPWIRIAAGALASLPFLFASGTANHLQASEFGQAYFAAFVVVAAILGALGGQMATADCIGREAREGTLGLLFLTSLSRWDIVLGRIAAGSVYLISLLLAAMPAAAVVWMLGGVSGSDWLRSMLALLNLIFVSMAAGMVATAFVREAIPSFLAGFGILFAVGLLPFVMEFTLDTHHAALALHLRHLTPLSLFELTPNPTSNWAGYAVNLATSHALGWLMIFIAGMGVERTRKQLANPSQRLPLPDLPAAAPAHPRRPTGAGARPSRPPRATADLDGTDRDRGLDGRGREDFIHPGTR
jgi:ABC-type transport system involved in multi-copper enzyme maturation permease subunit